LVDYKHDEFVSTFLRYYPANVKVRPGDNVTFRQAWTGEPHSVTMGKVVDEAIELLPVVGQYATPEEAQAGGVSEEVITKASVTFSKLPPMTNRGFGIYQPGAKPCFVEDYDAIPAFTDAEGQTNPDTKCPTSGKPQPRFNGRQGLYNSGFIPFQGRKENTFTLPIAADATPGTYQYYCNYHYFEMSGSVEVVDKGKSIPSEDAVKREAQREIAKDAKGALNKVRQANEGKFGDAKLPLAGRTTGRDRDAVAIDEFFPSSIKAKVGKPVTWTLEGAPHTVSFNVPKYFPIFEVSKLGAVRWDPQSYEPVAWSVPPLPEGGGPESPPTPRLVDVGAWDGKGGFHSSGFLVPGDTFTVTFTKAGTYPYACVLHPLMVGKVEVKA